MITLGRDCLLFQLPDGEMVPFSAEMISIEFASDSAPVFEPEVAEHAAKAVFHYFKNELGRQSVTAEEFAEAMQKVLRGLNLGAENRRPGTSTPVIETDLGELAREVGDGGELSFFPRLRNEMRQHLRQCPRLLRYRGLRACVKQIAGARRWTTRCRDLEEQIIRYLRECAGAETGTEQLAMLVE